MKFSENIEKTTLPGKKMLYRYFDEEGKFYRDAIVLETENPAHIQTIYHPVYPEKNTSVKGLKFESIHHEVVSGGNIKLEKQGLTEIHQYLLQRSALLPDEHKRFISPHIYKAGISEKLMETRNQLANQLNH